MITLLNKRNENQVNGSLKTAVKQCTHLVWSKTFTGLVNKGNSLSTFILCEQQITSSIKF